MVTQISSLPTLTTLPETWKRNSFSAIGALWLDSCITPDFGQIRKIPDLGSIHASVVEKKIDLFDQQIETHQACTPSKLAALVVVVIGSLGIFVMPSLGSIWHAGNCIYYVTLREKSEATQTCLKQHALSCREDLICAIAGYAIPYFFHFMANTDLLKKPLESVIFRIMFMGLMTSLIGLIWVIQQEYLLTNFSKPSIQLKAHFGLVGEGGWLLTSDPLIDMPFANTEATSAKSYPITKYCFETFVQMAVDILRQCSKAVDLLQLKPEESQLQVYARDPRRFLGYLDVLLNDPQSRIPCDREKLQKIAGQIRLLFERYNTMASFFNRFAHLSFRSFAIDNPGCMSYFVYNKDSSRKDLFGDFVKSLKIVQFSNRNAEGPTETFRTIKERILQAKDAYDVLGTNEIEDPDTIKQAYENSILEISRDTVDETWKAEADQLYQVVKLAKAYLDSLNTGHEEQD
jgi:hypothetical protein